MTTRAYMSNQSPWTKAILHSAMDEQQRRAVENLAVAEARRILDEQEGAARMIEPGCGGRTIDADGYRWWQPEAVGISTWALTNALTLAVADGGPLDEMANGDRW